MGSGTLKLMEWLDVAQLALPEAKACVQVNHLGLLMSVSVLVIRRLLSNGHHKPGRSCFWGIGLFLGDWTRHNQKVSQNTCLKCSLVQQEEKIVIAVATATQFICSFMWPF